MLSKPANQLVFRSRVFPHDCQQTPLPVKLSSPHRRGSNNMIGGFWALSELGFTPHLILSLSILKIDECVSKNNMIIIQHLVYVVKVKIFPQTMLNVTMIEEEHKLVGDEGFEPPTYCSQSSRSSQTELISENQNIHFILRMKNIV